MYLDAIEDSGEDVPQCLLDIRYWLRAEGHTDCWVRLDSAAAKIEALPFYDW